MNRNDLLRLKLMIVLALFVPALVSCTPGAAPEVEPAPVQAATQTPTLVVPTQVTATPTAALTATPTTVPSSSPTPVQPSATPTEAAPGCLSVPGVVEIHSLETTLLPDPLEFRVYLPPCYQEQAGQAYPVLYLIHGQSFTDDQWERLGAGTTADKLIAAGELPPFLIVMPRDRSWQEPTFDNFGRVIVEELLPWVDAHYRTRAFPSYRAVGGLSRGGGWAVHLGLGYWPLFGSVGVHSGFAFQSDANSGGVRRWLSSIPPELMPRIYMDVGDNDRPEIAQSAAWLERLLTEYGLAHEWHMFSGYHEEEYWQAHVEDYLRWYAAPWK